MMSKHVALLGAALVGLASCMNNELDTSSQQIAQENENAIQAYVQKNSLNTQRTASGLHYLITTPNPTGKKPAVGEEIEMAYVLSTVPSASNPVGMRVDSSKKDSSIFLPYGVSLVLPGLEEGLSLMREGEKATLLMPSYLAFGTQARPNIPANTPLRWDVTLLRSRSEDQQIDDYIAAKKLTVTERAENGLRFIKTKSVATGNLPTNGQRVNLRYTGRLIRATRPFNDNLPFDVTIGQNQVVRGFEEGLRRLKVGEKATVIFPSSLGYGPEGSRDQATRVFVIPPFSPLIFDLEVVAIQ